MRQVDRDRTARDRQRSRDSHSNEDASMRRLFLVATILASACSTTPDAPHDARPAAATADLRPTLHAELTASSPLVSDAGERALIEQAKGLVAPDVAAMLELHLHSRSIVGMTAPDPKVQAIIDRIFARRRARADSVASHARQIHNTTLAHEVTVALVDSLADPTASAEIRRRIGQTPSDVILLPAQHATVGALQAAMRGLDKLIRDEHQAAPTRNLRVLVHGELHVRSWSTAHNNAVAAQLAKAATRPKMLVQGIGSARSMNMMIFQRAP
jgi:hypothetical protein